MMLTVYRWATRFMGPAIYWHLIRRRARGKEDAARFKERLGHPGRARPEGPLVWIHAASVGESLSVLPLISALLEAKPDLSVMVTTGTVTSARLLGDRLPDRAFHHYVPVDRPRWVARFIEHWRPDLALWAESEFWPNLVDQAERRGVPMVLINGRISDRSFERWQRFPRSIAQLLGGFSLCLGQSELDAERLRVLGAKEAHCDGNLKYASPPLPVDQAALDDLRRSVADRPLWLAASTHPGEEAAVGRCHQALANQYPEVLTVVVPRHPERGADAANDLTANGLRVARRSLGEKPGPETQIYMADTMGELGLFFRLCPLVFIGKSLIGRGGQNPLEPARLGCAIVVGPHMGNFVTVTEDLIATGGCLSVDDEVMLAETIGRLLGDSNRVAEIGEAARREAQGKASVLPDIMHRLTPVLEALGENGHAAS
ncbi:3-deoxy-D-manno-octulosonic acid transferase [Magnetospira sp. QH-2]|uniref:3-deoxy-D-manno-octulosonic acid transferase n=1 Tax=Magnetospira sp. (strain QH-2) TaxID=1288970 RepID=UPI0003E81A21|nr:3-deoxy-D-manno-octulosonic acid transferase [Magnetospira sp. QH-2]CCQ74891.1 GT30 : 3-deoxy-D-manno-octulosonic-acid transferase (KDO transferase) [Magnetospira sp. QH-2]